MDTQTEPIPKRVYSVEEAAGYLGISRSYMYDLLRAEAVRSFKVGRRRLIRAADLDAFCEARVEGLGPDQR
jgi:excisionase family DNA binding protein